MSAVDLNSTIGAIFVGTFVATACWAASVCQLCFYFGNYDDDFFGLKLLVIVVFLVETTGMTLVIGALYQFLVSGFGDFVQLAAVNTLSAISIFFYGLTAFLVQCFFIFRIWKLSQSLLPVVLLFVLVLGQWAANIGLGASTFFFTSQPDINIRWTNASNIISVIVDIVLAAAMCTLLYRTSTEFTRTQTIVRRLIVFTLSTGLMTAIFALAVAISFLAYPGNFVFTGFYTPILPLYSNSFLATLNARGSMRRSWISDRSAYELDIATSSPRTPASRASKRHEGPAEISIHISTEVDQRSDNRSIRGSSELPRQKSGIDVV